MEEVEQVRSDLQQVRHVDHLRQDLHLPRQVLELRIKRPHLDLEHRKPRPHLSIPQYDFKFLLWVLKTLEDASK